MVSLSLHGCAMGQSLALDLALALRGRGGGATRLRCSLGRLELHSPLQLLVQ